MKSPEYTIQCQVISYIKLRHPNILYTIAPVVRLPIGLAKKVKAMGYTRGCPDIMIFEPRNSYHGLFIEIKTEKTSYTSRGILSSYQKQFIFELNKRGYLACVCYGFEQTIKTIDSYLL